MFHHESWKLIYFGVKGHDSDSGLLLHSSVVGVSVVTFVSPAKTADATWDADSGGPKEPCIRRRSRFLHGNGHF